ncbi:triose-phosphate transporter family-domain-containing protein [Xylariaceae sp. FL0804]|nr:triose-phosphate transporter family-domain-containing protein [Xylariaceae sp. FL0804]
MPLSLSNHPPPVQQQHLSPSNHTRRSSASAASASASAGSASAGSALALSSVLLAPHSGNPDRSNPSSASSATTSFQIDWRPSTDAVPSSSLSSAHPGLRRPEDIEMDPIAPAGHRRRRSTLTANLSHQAHQSQHQHHQHPHPNLTRPRSTSVKNPGDPEAKISEEDLSPGLPSASMRPDARDDDSLLSDEDLHDDEETGLTKSDKRRKRDKRWRNTRLDQRIVRDGAAKDERNEANRSIIRKLAVNAVLIGFWYLFSLSISLYNKWMFDSDQLNFPFPLFTTSMHMLVQFTLASLVLYLIPSLRPNNAPHSSDLGRSRHEAGPDRPLMTKMFYLTRIGPCGVATGLDIGLGNTSLKFITLTFYTMCKSSSLAFVLLFAFVFRLETPTWRLVAIIAIMTGGVVMMVAGEVQFDLVGFVLIISAAFFSGFRWGLTQILLLRHPATSNPFSSIFFIAPVMFIILILIAFPVEGLFPLIEGLKGLANEWGPVKTPLIILFPGTIAFLMTASEFALLQRSSVVTLSIAGIFKEVVTISAAALTFDDKLTPINISGLLVTIGAIGAYNWMKLSAMREDAMKKRDRDERGARGYQSGTSSDRGSGGESDGEEEEEGDGLLSTHHHHHHDASGAAEDNNLLTAEGDLIPKPRTPGPDDSSRQQQHRTDQPRDY